MKIRRPALESIAGVLALTACPVAAQADTVTMGVQMSLTSLASGIGSALNFGAVPANPLGGLAILSNVGTAVTAAVSGGGILGGTIAGTQGTLTFTRTVAVKAIVTAPNLITMSCPGGIISVSAFTVITAGTANDCNVAGTTTCAYNVGATASLPANLTTGSCSTATASFTVQYQ
jgi:hypothetical protein